MDSLFATLEGSALAQALRVSRWGYAALNATHIFGIALLAGASIPLNLRLLGLWPDTPLGALARVLAPIAATGLALAVAAGLTLFTVRATVYAGNIFLQIKLLLVVAGALSALVLHHRHGRTLDGLGKKRPTVHAVMSIGCWIGAILCGRLIAFAGE